MAVFAYRALGADTATVRGTIVADTPRTARDALRSRGLTIQEVVPVGAKSRAWSATFFRGRHTAKRVTFIRELSTLLAVGIPIVEAIDTIALPHRGPFKSQLLVLRDRVSEGQSLAEAMSQLSSPGSSGALPGLFDELAISITDVGEQSGTLDTALAQLADFQERSEQFRNRVVSALIYPAIVLVLGVGVAVFLMSFVVPSLLTTLVDAGQELPWATRVVKGASDLLLQRGWLLALLGTAAVAAVGLTLRSSGGRKRWHALQLRLPVVGDLLRKQAIARIAVVISTLIKSGVVFVRAVQIAQRSTSNLVLRESLLKCERAVEGGRDIAEALEATGAFPGVVVQVFAVGQQSGRLEEMLDRLAVDYDRQVTTATTRLTSVLEPLLIVALALLVGLIAFATILPILEAGNVF